MSDAESNIISILQTGPASSADLAQRLNLDTSTVTRRLSAMGAQVIRAGKGRSTRWYLSRALPLLAGQSRADDSVFPIYRVNPDGSMTKIANLHVVYPQDAFLVEFFRVNSTGQTKTEWHFYESLPWWLADM
ncbi:hypothetical protein CWE09_12250 [Aliidiomarina minuta]|uniref:Uncharacterized protein n=1 Tax=Aliidiomarina minuta TaxID=880057 RepID=A0A432W3H0_9GAMM|nr:winged helix-turn-helix transcriptional regulator [Aliidiomarina minuta]RUO23915.1 hypothetical protein CWE09_12250 [Aliidiomarina minuta]